MAPGANAPHISDRNNSAAAFWINQFPSTTAMETTDNEVKTTVKDYILREFLPGEDAGALDDSTLLITGGVLDSIGTVKLVSFLEERYGIELEAHELNAEYLDTLPAIARLVTDRIAGH